MPDVCDRWHAISPIMRCQLRAQLSSTVQRGHLGSLPGGSIWIVIPAVMTEAPVVLGTGGLGQ